MKKTLENFTKNLLSLGNSKVIVKEIDTENNLIYMEIMQKTENKYGVCVHNMRLCLDLDNMVHKVSASYTDPIFIETVLRRLNLSFLHSDFWEFLIEFYNLYINWAEVDKPIFSLEIEMQKRYPKKMLKELREYHKRLEYSDSFTAKERGKKEDFIFFKKLIVELDAKMKLKSLDKLEKEIKKEKK